MRDLTTLFFDAGDIRGLPHSALCVLEETGPSACTELVTFSPDCYDEQGNCRPEVLKWLRALVNETTLED